MKPIVFFTSLLMFFLFSGCESNHGRGISDGLPVTGKVGEILVVCDDDIWKSELRECLDSNLTQFIIPYFPDVATFKLVHKEEKHFTQGVKRWRNTLFLNLDPKHKGDKGIIEKRPDVWAKGQMVIDITARDFDQLIETCKYGMDEVHDEFDEIEWRRLMTHFDKSPTKRTREKIQQNFGIDVVLPTKSAIVTHRKNFFRVEFLPSSRPIDFAGTGKEDIGAVFSGLLIYQYDYTGEDQLEFTRLMKARDTMLKHNVPHEAEGYYMGTQYQMPYTFPVGNEATNANGDIKGYEIKGMFQFIGPPNRSSIGGGAFWSFHFVHPERKKLICLSGYVDAPPTTSWTHFIREIQAILRSVEIVK